MAKQVWQLYPGEGGWLSPGQIYHIKPESYSVRNNAVLVPERAGINQVYIWRATDGYHGHYDQDWNFDHTDVILPDDVIALKSFTPFIHEGEEE